MFAERRKTKISVAKKSAIDKKGEIHENQSP